jgi:probable HAF family extracellular repeat protein
VKSKRSAISIAMALLAALAIPVRPAGQKQQEHNNKLPHYRVVELGTLGGTFSGALAINSKGWVTGFSALPGDANLHALLWREGVKTDLGTLGGPNSTPNGFMDSASVNQQGEIAGAAESFAAAPLGENFFLCNFNDGLGLLCLPFFWEDGAMMSLPTLGGNNGAALSWVGQHRKPRKHSRLV